MLPRPTWGLSGRVRPMSLGSGNQNWKTAPPLASGHLNERSAPGDTGSPCSIFRKDSRNPINREDKERKRQTGHTQREEKRLLKRWRQAQDSTFRLLSMGYGAWGKKSQGTHMPLPPSTLTSRLTARCRLLGRTEKSF